MKLFIAVALLVVGLSPCPGFSQAPTDAVRVSRVEFYYRHQEVYMNIFFNYLMESFDRNSVAPCFLNQLVFRNMYTNKIFQAENPSTCYFRTTNSIMVQMNPRDHLRMIVNEFIDINSTTSLGLEMYTADMLGAPLNLRIEPDDAIECDVILNLYSYGNTRDHDYWTDKGILLIHFHSFIDITTVNASKLSLSRTGNNYWDASTVKITDGQVLNQSPGLTLSVTIRLTSNDQDLLTSKGICTGGNDTFFLYDCYLGIESGFAALYFGQEISPTTEQVDNIRRAPTESEPVTVSIRLEYIDGLTLNITLGLGQPFYARAIYSERVISVMCTSSDTNEHVNPMLEIYNGAVPIPPNYIQNDWPNSTTLNAPRGIAEPGLEGYYTCRTEGDTFFSPHTLESGDLRIFFYQGASATVDVHNDIVLRFAHGVLDRNGHNDPSRFSVFVDIDRHNEVPFEYRFESDTPFPYHAELHIKKTRFNYEGEYYINFDYFALPPNFIIHVNEPKLTLYPPILTVLSSDPPDTTASLTCTSDNTNVPVLFSGDYTSLGITTTYLDDTGSSVRLDFELDKRLIGMLEGMEFICEARDPDDFQSTVSTTSSIFREMSAPLSLFAIEPDSDRKQVMDGAMINTTSSFECLWYINPTRTNIKSIPGTLFWTITHLETKEEIEITSDVSGKDFIVTALENGITLNILGKFVGSVSCIYGNDSVKINVVDINECSLLNGGCHHLCNNTIGGFYCSCEEGYTINTDNRTCQVDPVAMCDASNSCAQLCVKLSGVETCGCLLGYELASNGINCTNINECHENPCEQICTDLEGGYECSCREGYQLLPGGRCTDVNECLVAALGIYAADLCEPSMFCVNVEGNYSCECLARTLLVEGVCEAEGALTTVPDDAIPNAVVVDINGFTPSNSTFTPENQRRFREATADAVNAYCEDKECLVAYPQARARRNTLTADNLYIAGITSTGNSSVSFSLYARLIGGILSGSALATAVLDHRDEYAALGFNVTSVQLPTESTTILTTNQIIGIAMGCGLGLVLILVLLLITITCCCVKHELKQPKKGGDLTNVGTSLDMKAVPYEGLKEQAVGLESEEKEEDLDYERYKLIK